MTKTIWKIIGDALPLGAECHGCLPYAASNPDELLALIQRCEVVEIWPCEVVEKVFDSGYCVRDELLFN